MQVKKKLALWINTQKNNFIKKEHIMTKLNIQESWKNFIQDDMFKAYI